MPSLQLRTPREVEVGFQRIRDELQVPPEFPPEVEAAAGDAASAGPLEPAAYRDATDIELVTIDPAGSRDLDQAFEAARTPDGYRVHYAIADVAAFVAPAGLLDREAHLRGVTRYAPDKRTPLYPDVLSEGAASLLPDQVRPALLWTIDLDPEGEHSGAHLERTMVRSRRALSYAETQALIDGGTAPESLMLLREIGDHRLRIERERGAVSLNVPTQEIVRRGDRYTLEYNVTLPVERWNAQISLLTGICAADIMTAGGVGVLRTLPPPRKRTIRELKRCAHALGVEWPDELSYPDLVRSLDPAIPDHAALTAAAVRVFRGAGYVAFTGDLPPLATHAAIASTYAHVTAPLRRLVDRYANEVVLALCAGADPPAWALETLPKLPSLMGKARGRERSLERAIIDYVEAVVLADRIGDQVDAVVVGLRDDGRSTVQLREPAVLTNAERLSADLGDEVQLIVAGADPETRTVDLRSP